MFLVCLKKQKFIDIDVFRLSIKDETLAKALYSASVMKHITLMLMSYQLDGGYLDRLADWLIDIEYIITETL